MKTKTVETFQFKCFPSACITQEDGWFKPWWNGCAIGPSERLRFTAEKVIFDFIVNYTKLRKAEAEQRLKELDNVLVLLGADVNNLKHFKV